jgi:DNA primase
MPYLFSDEEIELITERNDIVDVISEYIQLKKAGANFKALCPFHNEKTPSFMVSPSKQIFHCFGCGEGGDVIKFIMKYQNLNFVEAVEILAERAGIVINKNKKKNDQEISKLDILYKINRDAALYFFNMIKTNKKAYVYIRNRGIDDKTIKAFGIGYSNPEWDDLLKYLKSKGYNEVDIEKAGLIIKRKDGSGYYDRFRDRIMFPIIDVKGRVIGFGGRVLDDSLPKYLNSPDTPVFLKGNNLYGLNIVKKNSRGKYILLVEGYMDVISLYNHGIDCCVASLGTALTESQAKLLKRYSDTFYICYDSDNAGQRAADKALDIFKNIGIDAKVIILPEGKDPDEYIKSHSKESFEDLTNSSLSYIDYKIYFYKGQYDLSTIEGKIEFTKRISEVLKNIKSPIEVDAYISKVSQDTGISIDAIKREIYRSNNIINKTKTKDKYIFSKYRDNNKDKIVPIEYKLEPGHLLAEKSLLKLIINNKNIYNKVKNLFTPNDFLNEILKRVAHVIYNEYETHGEILQENLIDLLSNDELKEFHEINKVTLQFDSKDEYKVVDDYINKINYYKLKLERDKVKEEIKKLESKEEKSKGDVERFKGLCLKLIEIDRQLKLHQ